MSVWFLFADLGTLVPLYSRSAPLYSVENILVLVIMALCGLGIIAVWTADIFKGDKVDLSPGFFRARDHESGGLFWPHWVAEYLTGICLVLGAFGNYFKTSWGKNVALLSLGALIYTAINHQSWALANKERRGYAIIMGISLLGALVALGILLY